LLDDGFRNSAVTVADWRKLFEYRWLARKPNLGFVALDRNTIVGFVGAIYADRTIDDRTVRVCNLTSWYVRPEYRGLGGYLLASALRDDAITYTAFTPILLTRHALAKLGFERIVASKRVFPPLLHLDSAFVKAPRITFDPVEIRAILRGEQLRIFEDHLQSGCVQAAIVDGADACYIVSKRRVRRGRLHPRLPITMSIPYSELLYCSNPQLLVRHLERIKLALLWREKTLALMVDDNMLAAERPRGLTFESRTMFRSRDVKGHELDKLYSELVLLPI
jgi:acetoacetyl-CoA synthetase